MSLKAFHVFFVTCSVILSVAFGFWALTSPAAASTFYRVLGIASFALAVLLVVYGIWFLRKLKNVSFL